MDAKTVRTRDWLSECLREWREWRGLSIEQAAARMDVTPARWLHWEQGVTKPTGRQLRELQELGVYIPLPFLGQMEVKQPW